MTKTKEDVLRQIDEGGVRYIRLCFTDILGKIKGMSITRSEIEQVLEEGQGFDGSSVEGFARIEESDLMAVPDPLTFRIIPWEISGERVAMMFCDIQNTDGTPYDGDPRWVLKRHLFGTQVRTATVAALEAMDIPVECSHHEVAPSQHEIDLKYQEALVMADFAQVYRFIVKEVAMQNEIYATFMPKPIYGINGSGMHCHQSIFSGDKNLFFDSNAQYNLSKMARHYMAGILRHVKEFALITNQWVNSYKRLVPDYEAPVYISWGRRNRSSMVRVPMYRTGKEQATRIELRSPDPAANPYLVYACMLAAGMKGIENEYELGEPIEENIFHMSKEEKLALKIDELPNSLENAVREFEGSQLARETLGDHIFNALILNKQIEWDSYRIHVSKFEMDKYLSML
jgi:glutamine synthetase